MPELLSETWLKFNYRNTLRVHTHIYLHIHMHKYTHKSQYQMGMLIKFQAGGPTWSWLHKSLELLSSYTEQKEQILLQWGPV